MTQFKNFNRVPRLGALLPGALTLLTLLTLLTGCYYFREGEQLISLYSQAQDIDKLLAAGGLEPDEERLLLLVQEIRNFALTELHLKANKNYTTYLRLEQDYLADVVSACKSDSFEQYQWSYLFMGNMPYKGFFKKADADAEAKRLAAAGYDVYAREVDAFSTLGFFSDPIFSYMKDYSLFTLAGMLIHEQMHATLFLKPHVDFSENMAEFVGEQGALLFIKKKYGEQSSAYIQGSAGLEDSKTFNRLIFGLYEELDKLYKSGLPQQEKLAEKEHRINAWKEKYKSDYTLNFKTRRFARFPEGTINNAVLCTLMNYTNNQAIFDELYRFKNSDLVETIQALQALTKQQGDPVTLIREYMAP